MRRAGLTCTFLNPAARGGDRPETELRNRSNERTLESQSERWMMVPPPIFPYERRNSSSAFGGL